MTIEQRTKKPVADMLRRAADDIESGKVNWVWLGVQYLDGVTVKYATKDAPSRPGGIK